MTLDMYDDRNPCVVCPLLRERDHALAQCDDPFCNENRHRKACAYRDHPRGRARWIELNNPSLANWSA